MGKINALVTFIFGIEEGHESSCSFIAILILNVNEAGE
jgi:hypothetical protein